MNNKRRKKLDACVELLVKAWGIVEGALDDERDMLDNIPASLQSGSKYERMEEMIDQLENASEQIDGAIECIKEAVA